VGVSWSGGIEGRRSSPGDRTSPPPGGVLTVWDTGPGFAGDPSRVFAPFYTTKPRGTGLGLAITQRIVRAHGWTIEPERRDDHTVFVINIPASDVAMAVSEPPLSSDGERGMEVA
jgi:signal transduction histidine kinase